MSVVLRYAFNGDTADLGVDSSESSLNMSSVNVTSSTDPTYSGVASFNGTSYLDLISSSVPSTTYGSNSRTFSVWVNPTSASGILFSIGDETLSGSLFRVSLNASRQVLIEYSTLTDSVSSTTLTLGSWSHVLVMYTGTNVMCYINGSSVFDDSRVIDTVNTTLSIGRDSQQGVTDAFVGFMSDFILYDHTLDTGDISDIYSYGPNELLNLDSTDLVVFAEDGIQGEVIANQGVVAVGDVTTRGLTLISEKESTGDTSVESFSYLYDDSTSERVCVSKRLNVIDEDSTYCTSSVQLSNKDSVGAKTLETCLQYNGESVNIKSISSTGDEVTSTVNFDGLSFDSDEASITLGSLSEFRIKYDDVTDTLQIQSLSGGSYVTKVEYGR